MSGLPTPVLKVVSLEVQASDAQQLWFMSHINNETLGFVSRFGCSGLVGFNRAHGRKSHERKAIINFVLTAIRQAPRCHVVADEIIIISHATSKYLLGELINLVRSRFGRDSQPKPRLIYGLNLQRVQLPFGDLKTCLRIEIYLFEWETRRARCW